MKKKTRVSSIILTLLFSLLLLVNSCSNIFDNDISETYEQTEQEDKASDDDGSDNQNPGGQAAAPAKRYATLTGNIGLNGAYPLQVRNDVENTHVAPDTSFVTNANQTNRSAIPALPAGFQYFIKAVYRDSLNIGHEVNGIVNEDRSYVITLELDVEYELISGIKYNYGGNIGEKTLLEDRKPNVVLSDTQASFNYNFILKPLTTGGNGKIELTMTVPTSITAARAECISEDETIKNQWNTAVEAYENNHTEPLVNVSGTTATLNLDEIKSGCYEIAFSFLNQAGGYSLYSTVQTVNVFENMITETWTNGGNRELISDDGVFAITQALLVKYSHQNIYVGNTGVAAPNDDESRNAGTAYSPFGNFNKALDLIAAENIATNDYTIHVYGTQSGNFSITDIIDSHFNSITIVGESRTDEQNNVISPVLSAANPGSVLSVSSTKPVKLKNITITGGNAVNGGGLSITNGAQVTLDNGTLITGNTASGLGSGVYVEGEDSSPTPVKSTLYMRGTARIALTDDVYLADGNKIKVSGTLTSSGQVAKITPIGWTRGRVVLEASNTSLLQNSLNKFAMQDSEFHIERSSTSVLNGVLNAYIYVVGTNPGTGFGEAGDGANARGTMAYPFATVSRALQECSQAIDYEIKIAGAVTNPAGAAINISTTEPTKITFSGVNGNTQDKLIGNGASVFTINTTTPIVISNLAITGGNGGTNFGGGLHIALSGADVTLETGALIGDTANPSSAPTSINDCGNSADSGGGIRSDGKVTLKNGSVISHNYSSVSAGGGGGAIFLEADGQLFIEPGAKIIKNSAAVSGGAIYSEGTVNITGGEISGNVCDVQGGAICTTKPINMEGDFWIPCTGEKQNDIAFVSSDSRINITGSISLPAGKTGANATLSFSSWDRGKEVLTEESAGLLTANITKIKTIDEDFTINNIADSSKGVLSAPIYLASQGEDSTRIGTASNSSNTRGTRAYPVSTMASALSLVNSSNTIITIDGTLTGKQEISGTINADEITIIGRIAEGSTTSAATLDGGYESLAQDQCTLLINTDKKVTIQHLTIKGGKNSCNYSYNNENHYEGGGISIIHPQSNVFIGTGAVITDNTAAQGAGICFSGTLTIEDGAVIKKNIATVNGGGIQVANVATGSAINHLYIKGGTIGGATDEDANKAAYYGAGVSLYKQTDPSNENGELVMTGGTISHNLITETSSGSHSSCGGAGIYIGDTATGIIKGGKIEYNNAGVFYGGGIFNYGTLTVENGTDSNNQETISEFTANSAKAGGAIFHAPNTNAGYYSSSGIYFTLKGGKFRNNTATNTSTTYASYGGAVYAERKFSMSGKPDLYAASNGINYNDVVPVKDNDAYIVINGNFDSSVTTVASITPNKWRRGNEIIASSSYVTDENLAKFTFTDPEWVFYKEADGVAAKARVDAPLWVSEVAIPGVTGGVAGNDTTGNGTQKKPYKTITTASQQIWKAGTTGNVTTVINVSGTLNCTSNSGSNYIVSALNYVTVEIEGHNSATINGAGYSCCALRCKLSGTNDKAFLKNIEITGADNTNDSHNAKGGGIYIEKGNVELGDGVIISDNTADLGGGIYVTNGYELKITGSTSITKNFAIASGGAIYNAGTIEMNAGSIGGSTSASQNRASNTISDLDALGGAIYQAGTFNIGGGAKIYTGGATINDVYLPTDSSVVAITANINDNGNTSGSPITLTHGTWTRGKDVVTGSSYIHNNIAKFQMSDPEFEILESGSTTKSGKIDAPIYVAGSSSVTVGGVTYGAGKTPTNGGLGTKAKPYSTIADAVSQCWKGPNDTVVIDPDDEAILVGRKINIVGTVSGAQQIGNGITTAKASAITLTGVSGTTPTLNGGFTNGSKGRTLTLGTALPVIIKSLKITGGYANGNGGGIYKDTTADLTIAEGAEISGNYATAGGGGIYGQGTLIINGGTISGNHALNSNSGGGIYTNSTVEMSAGTVSGNTAGGYGGGMYAGTLELSGGTISGNEAVSGGGGVYSYDVTMTGGTISGNSVTTTSTDDGYGGGGIFIDNNGSFIMEGGAISGNSAVKNGGGVYLLDAYFLMYNTAVIGEPAGDTSEGATTLYAKDEDHCSNYAGAKGGGIYAAVDSTVGIGFSNSSNYGNTNPSYSFTGGIYYNFAEEDGGGIYKWNGFFKMGYGNIQYNGAARGGGVYTQGGLTMAGGNIHTNYAKATTDDTCGGGGVYSEGSVKMYGTNSYWARIINNVAEKNGGGLYLAGTSLYLTQYAVIGDESYESYATATSNSNCANNNGGGVYVTGNGNICMGYASAEDKANATETNTRYGGISGNYAAVNGGGIYNASNNTITLGTASSRLQYNGAGGDGGGVYSETKNVTLVSSSYPDYTVYYNHADNNGGGIYTCATIEMKGGKVNKNSATKKGGGIYLGYSGAAPKIYITGGLIGTTAGSGAATSDPTKCGNYAQNGGGIYGDKAEIYIGYNSSNEAEGTSSVSRVVRNFASESGGGIFIKGDRYNTAVLKIRNGKVDYNGVSSMGAGIYLVQCAVTLETGSSVSYNEASLTDGYGGGIYVQSGSFSPYPAFDMSDGSINNNKASQGGGIRHYDGHVTINITGGEIKNNESTGLGGGMYLMGNIKINGAVDVTGNKSTNDKGGAAAILGGQTLTLEGNVNISGSNSQGMNDIFFAAGGPRLKLTGLLGAVNGTTKFIYLSGQDNNFYNNGQTSAYVTGDTALNHSKFKVLPDGSGNTYTLNGSGLLVQD